jgi:hypothetical protein
VQAVRLFGQLNLRLDSYSTLPLELALVDSIAIEDPPAPVPAAASAPATPAEPSPTKPAPRAPVTNGTRPAPHPASRPASASPAARPSPPRPATIAPVNSTTKPAPAPSKPAAAPEPVRAAPVAPLEASTEIERLKLNWKQIAKQAPADVQRAPALGILRSGPVKPVSIQENVVCLSCGNQIFKDMIEKIENQRVIERVISSFLGRTCRIQCVLEEKDNHLVEEALKIPGAQFISVEEK